MKSAPTLVCELRRSRIEPFAISLLTAAALLAPWLAPVGAGTRVALSLAALAAAGWAVRDWSARDWRELSLGGDGAVVLRAVGRADWRGALAHATVLGPLVVLAMRHEGGGMLRLPIYPDGTDGDSLRRLRVLLRHGWRTEAGDAIR